MTRRMTVITAFAVAGAPQAALAQTTIPLMSQRVQVSPPQPWPERRDDTGLIEPIHHPALPGAPAVKAVQVGVRLEIGSRGYVTRCTVTRPSRYAELNRQSCEGLVFNTLQPARDAAGKPMPATLNTVVKWRLSGPPPKPEAEPATAPGLEGLFPPPPIQVSPPSPPEAAQPLWPLPSADSWTAGPIPRGSPQAWITNDDYPSAALRWEQQGPVAFVLLIDAAGVPLDCVPSSFTGSWLLERYTCDLMMTRARFNPARNAQGVLVPSTWRSRMRWELPTD